MVSVASRYYYFIFLHNCAISKEVHSPPWPMLTHQGLTLDTARISKMEIWILRGDCLLKCPQRNIGSCSAKKYRNKCWSSYYYLPGTVLGMGEPARNKPDKIFAFMKLTFSKGQETNTRVRERAKEHGWVSWQAPETCLWVLWEIPVVLQLPAYANGRWFLLFTTSRVLTKTQD